MHGQQADEVGGLPVGLHPPAIPLQLAPPSEILVAPLDSPAHPHQVVDAPACRTTAGQGPVVYLILIVVFADADPRPVPLAGSPTDDRP